jgi:hypothetical protein
MASKAEKSSPMAQSPSAWRHRRFLTPEEDAEFMDSLNYDNPPADLADCTDCDPRV